MGVVELPYALVIRGVVIVPGSVRGLLGSLCACVDSAKEDIRLDLMELRLAIVRFKSNHCRLFILL